MENEQEKPTVSSPTCTALLCDDCKKSFDVPFDNGDGKVRCAGCATDFYMKDPRSRVTLKQRGIVNFNAVT